jgi:hypothetical protein
MTLVAIASVHKGRKFRLPTWPENIFWMIEGDHFVRVQPIINTPVEILTVHLLTHKWEFAK